MKPTIMKFGGTSVEGATAFKNAARIVLDRQALRPVVVVSAMAGFTDALLDSVQQAFSIKAEGAAAKSIGNLEKHFDRHGRVIDALLREETAPMHALVDKARDEISKLLNRAAAEVGDDRQRRKFFEDAIVSYGERLSAAVLAAVLRENKILSRDVDPRHCIITNDNYGCAIPLMGETFRCTHEQLQPLLEASSVPVLGGFVGSTTRGETTTLGRGGSDYTAALIGAALDAKEIQIWTDVPGVLTADPRIVPEAQTIPVLSYQEAAELAYFGAKVLHPKTIQPAVDLNIPVRVCNSRAPRETGTLIVAESEATPQTIKAIAHKTGITTVQVTSARMLGAYGFLRALFEVFDRHRTAVDVVTTSEVSVSLSIDDAGALPDLLSDLEQLGTVEVEKSRAIVCVVGEGLRATAGIAARIFSTISDINVSLISQGASSINLTFAVEQAHVAEAVNRLHQEFFQRSKRPHSMEKVAGGAEVRY